MGIPFELKGPILFVKSGFAPFAPESPHKEDHKDKDKEKDGPNDDEEVRKETLVVVLVLWSEFTIHHVKRLQFMSWYVVLQLDEV